MERGLIVTEYHQLRDYLNRANKLSNQNTELKFEIEQYAMLNTACTLYHMACMKLINWRWQKEIEIKSGKEQDLQDLEIWKSSVLIRLIMRRITRLPHLKQRKFRKLC